MLSFFIYTEFISELSLKRKLILQFTVVSLFMTISGITGVNSPVTVTEIPKQEVQIVREVSKKDLEKLMSTEQYVKQYFSDIPVMAEIAWCESRFRHFDNEGNPIKNRGGSSATGVMQIMASIHSEDALELGMDINTLEGNVQYARHLYDKFGTKPWQADKDSKNCWQPRAESLALAY